MTNPRDAIKQQLVRDAQDEGWDELWARVVGARLTLLSALTELSDKQAAWRPPAGAGEAAWSAAEITRHVAAYSSNVLAIIEATARGEAVVKDPPGALDAGPAGSPRDLRRVLFERSAAIASIVERLPPEPDLAATVPHAFFGPLNSKAWFLFLAVHDGDHTRQLESLRAAPGFPLD